MMLNRANNGNLILLCLRCYCFGAYDDGYDKGDADVNSGWEQDAKISLDDVNDEDDADDESCDDSDADIDDGNTSVGSNEDSNDVGYATSADYF